MREVPFGEFLKPNKRPYLLGADEDANLVGMRLYGVGPFHREFKSATKIQKKSHFVIRAGDVIYNKLFAWKGTFGIVPPELDRMFVSDKFPTYELDATKADRDYLRWYFRHPPLWEQARQMSIGSAALSKLTLNPPRFLDLTVPLPPLPEQRRIVAKVEELAAKIEEARGLRSDAISDTTAMLTAERVRACKGSSTASWRASHPNVESASSLLNRIASRMWAGHARSRKRRPIALPTAPEVPPTWMVLTAGELQEAGVLLDIQDGNHGGDYPRKSEFSVTGVPFVTAAQISDQGVDIIGAPRLPQERAQRLRIGFAKGGDVLLTHNASVGAVARSPLDAGDFLLGTSATYWRCNEEAVDPEYLMQFMKSGHFQGQLAWIMKQTTRNQVSVLKQVNLWVVLPPLEEQQMIAGHLSHLQAKVDSLKALQTQSAAELDALLPSILDKAFKGEL